MTAQPHSLTELWANHIPLVSAMELEFRETDTGWYLEAPLNANRNHMGTGFGGSIAAIATLAGWTQTWMVLPKPDDVHIIIAKSSINYRKPAHGPLIGTSDLPSDEAIALFLHRLNKKGRASISLTTRVHSNDIEAATLVGKFAATFKSNE